MDQWMHARSAFAVAGLVFKRSIEDSMPGPSGWNDLGEPGLTPVTRACLSFP